MDVKERIAENLKRLRKEKGLTQGEVASKIFLSERAYQTYELKTSWPSLPALMRLAELYEKDIKEIIC